MSGKIMNHKFNFSPLILIIQESSPDYMTENSIFEWLQLREQNRSTDTTQSDNDDKL
jgi:hypothetical protein